MLDQLYLLFARYFISKVFLEKQELGGEKKNPGSINSLHQCTLKHRKTFFFIMHISEAIIRPILKYCLFATIFLCW